jgi:hypothetical protein
VVNREVEQGVRGRRHMGGFENRSWITFRSVYSMLFIYLHFIVLVVPDSITISVSKGET